MGLNDDGVVAAVLNRDLTLGPAPGKRSRGELPLRALEHRSAADAAGTLARIDPAGAKSLWLMRSDGTDLQVVASLLTLEPPPRLANPVWGFYGYTPWRNFFDWSSGL